MGGMGGGAAASSGCGWEGLGRSFAAEEGNGPVVAAAAAAEATAAAAGVPTGPGAAAVLLLLLVEVMGGLSLVEASPSPSTRLPTAG